MISPNEMEFIETIVHPHQGVPVVDEEKVRTWIREACEANGTSHLSERIQFYFTSGPSVAMGRAHCMRGVYEVELFKGWWLSVDEADRIEIVKHEACHIIAFWLFGPRALNHGEDWQGCMKRVGIVPREKFDITDAQLTKYYLNMYK